MTPADISRLESLAREATPGPWVADDTNEQLFGVMKDGVLHYLGSADPGLFSTSPTTAEQEVANAAYIAAANPAAVLALIELLAQCKATLEALHPSTDLPDSDVARLYNAMMEKLDG